MLTWSTDLLIHQGGIHFEAFVEDAIMALFVSRYTQDKLILSLSKCVVAYHERTVLGQIQN